MLKPIVKFIAAMNGYLKKEQIAAGFSWGILLGLIPAGNVFWIGFFVISFFFKHHHWSKVLVMAVVKLLSGQLNPLVDMAGWEILHLEALQPAFTAMYNMPLVAFTKFNNTLVAGGVCAGIILWLPVYLVVLFLVPPYRNRVVPKIRNSKVYKAFMKAPLVSTLAKAVAAASDSTSVMK